MWTASIALAGTAILAGCGGSVAVGYRAYDPYRSGYRTWDANEGIYYNQWVGETHRDPHRDYRRLKKNDQNDYWKWRNDHPDRH